MPNNCYKKICVWLLFRKALSFIKTNLTYLSLPLWLGCVERNGEVTAGCRSNSSRAVQRKKIVPEGRMHLLCGRGQVAQQLWDSVTTSVKWNVWLQSLGVPSKAKTICMEKVRKLQKILIYAPREHVFIYAEHVSGPSKGPETCLA